MSIFATFGISILSGFILLVLLLIMKILWSWVLENWYLKIACRHVADISGRWDAEYQDINGHNCYDQTELKQYGHKITGTQKYRIVYKGSGGEKHKVFLLRGIVRNDIFTAYYWNADRKQKGCGSFALGISREGDIMRGKYAWFDVEADKFDTGDLEWKRVT